MKNESGSSRMDTVLKMLLIAFVSLLAFSSGVYFGKQLSDSDYQLKALESDFNPGGAAKVGAHDGDEPISEEEVAALSDKLVNAEKEKEKAAGGAQEDEKQAAAETKGHDDHAADTEKKTADAHGKETREVASAKDTKAEAVADNHEDKHGDKQDDKHGDQHGAKPAAPAHQAAAADTHGDKQDAKPDLSAASKAAERVANNHPPSEPAKPKEPSRIPTSLPKTVGTSHDVEFTVQVASYPTAEAAKDYANELVAKGFPAFPVEATIGGKKWYRVSVGSFKTQDEANAYRVKIVKQASLPSAIVQKIQRQ